MPEPISAWHLSPTPTPAKGNARLVGVVGASAAALLIATVAQFEGKRNDPYFDIVRVQTVCFGETRVAMHRYSDAECTDMLANGLADFAEPVLKRNPELAGHPELLAAATSLAYNIGGANYAKSTVARRFSQGRWRDACNAFLMWTNAGGKKIAGLVRRREAERELCLTGKLPK
jgi:lysozyme